jgi:putative ABC transport system permease protein
VRQLLTESVLLSLLGGAIGLLLAVWWSQLLIKLAKDDIPRAVTVGIDWRVLGFTIAISVLTGLIFGLVPAFQSSSTALTESLKEGGRGSCRLGRRNGIRGLLVVVEMAVAVVLLVGAGLLIQSLWRLQHVDPGLRPENVLTFNVVTPDVRYPGDKGWQFFKDLEARIATLPGVQSASSVYPLPLSGDRFSISFKVDGRPVAPKDEPSADFFVTDVGYFKTMGIPILKGRDFDQRDQHHSSPVIIVTQEFARRHFPNEDPLGKRIQPGIGSYENEKTMMREIVGVVGDVKSRGLDTEVRPAYYVPQTQVPFSQMVVVAKTSVDPHTLIKAANAEVAAIDKELPVFSAKTMDEYLSDSVTTPRFNTTLLSIFAGVALILTIVGWYGVMSYSVTQRTNEIGIRLALGAQSSHVLRMVITQGLRFVVIGLVIGLVGAFALTRLLTSLLFGIRTSDPLTFVAVSLLLLLVALLACYLPARRATRVDPMEALRCE